MPNAKLPQEPTWKLLGVSDDMMDTQFCNKRFPFPWRSSLAIYAYEPPHVDLPEGLCEGRITFLKVTATITGYQPTSEETAQGYASFPHVPVEDLAGVIEQYFACYGALISVAVFPNPIGNTKLNDFPHIIDVEPKTRDLIQAATEVGEILTSSKSNVKTNKSLTHTESSETGWKLTTTGGYGTAKDKPGPYGSVTGELSHKNTETEQENWSVATDASRERQEKEGSTMQISQLYNLLSSYHIGTNRVQFLMLARPHILQPTEHRTFIQGLRRIEGVQDFILIVARPPEMPGLCIEAALETGHFPEGLLVEQPEEQFAERHEEFKVVKHVRKKIFGQTDSFSETYTVEAGWIVDTRQSRDHDPGHPGIKEIANNSNPRANNTLEEYNYRRIEDGTVQVSGKIRSSTSKDAKFDRTYRVFTRSVQPRNITGESKVPVDTLLVTGRNLCVCFKSGQQCPVLGSLDEKGPFSRIPKGIYSEHRISLSRDFTTPPFQPPAIKELLRQVQDAMLTSGRLPRRYAYDEAIGFLESDYFKNKVKRFLPQAYLASSLDSVPNVSRDILIGLGEQCTVAEALEIDLVQFARRTGLNVTDAANARRDLLRPSRTDRE